MSEPVRIVFKKKGTIVVPGPVEVRDEDGNPVPLRIGKDPSVVKFCGCGRSKEKPFCDGSHKEK